MSLISIIIPAYNAEEYIEKCMCSVLRQTLHDIEVICIDDGSTDDTGKIFEAYAKEDNRIKVVHQANTGQAMARKIGVGLAKGDYIAFVDSDDWIQDDMYEKMYFYAQKFDVDAVCVGYFSVKDNSSIKVLPDTEPGLYTNVGDKAIYKILYNIEKSKRILSWTYWTYLFKKEKVYDYVMKVKDIEQGEDMVGVWSFLVNAKKIYILNEAYYYYRVRTGSSCRKENPNYLTNINTVYTLLKQEFKIHNQAAFLLNILKYAMFDIVQSGSCFTSERQDFFMFPYERIPANSKVVLYGAGMVGKSYFRQIRENQFCDITLWIDKAYKTISNSKYRVQEPDSIRNKNYEYILIATLEYEAAKKISKYLTETYQVSKEKIVIYEPKRLSKFVDLDNYSEVKEKEKSER